MNFTQRYLLLFIFMCLFVRTTDGQETNNVKFDQGVTFFTSGNYNAALQFWMEIYNTGVRSAELNYNIGNAFFKLNDIPNSILFYERAYNIKPADENINYNLQIARTLIVDRFQEIPEVFFVKWYNFISLFLSTNTWAKLSISFFVFSLIFLSLYIYSSNYRNKVSGFWLALIFFILSSAFLAFAGRNRTLVYDSHRAIILSPIVTGKSSPDSSGTDLFVLHEGTKVLIEDEVGEWVEIRLSDGNKGWVSVKSLSII